MLFRTGVRYVVKVLSASLIESFPPAASKSETSAAGHATLTFHLHRSSLSEPYDVALEFEAARRGRSPPCFVRTVSPSLTSSSAVLKSVFLQGSPASPEAVCVLTVNGTAYPSEELVQEVIETGHDVVLQCSVKTAILHASQSTSGTEAVEEEKAEVEDDDAGRGAVQLPKRRGRPPLANLRAPRRVLKRQQNKGTRADIPTLLQEAEDAALVEDMAVLQEAGAAATVAELSVAADAITEAALHALEDMAPVKETATPTRQRRRRRTKLEMAKARSLAAAAAASGTEREEPSPDTMPSDVWFKRQGAEETESEEVVEASGETLSTDTTAHAPRKRRGRPRKAAATPEMDDEAEEEEAAVEAPRSRGKGGAKRAVKRAAKSRRGRKAKPSKDAEPAPESFLDEAVEGDRGEPDEVLAF